ncbi:MAG: VWA domain-containing protein [Methylococcales bacterium]|nr:VWA domain-containing protein [Methylococcales bacterium]
MNLADLHFIRPYWLVALLPAAVFCIALFRRHQSMGLWSDVCDAALLPFILQQKSAKQSRVPLLSGAIAAFLTIIALAGPTWERLPSPVFRNDSALVIVLDLSLSMNAADITPSRLIRARYKIADILKRRKDGQTALLVYAGDAFTVTPLTNDTETIDSQLSALTTEIMPSQGNDTALALQKAVDLFKQAGLPKGQILLVTDGVEVDKALPVLRQNASYTLSVLAVGTADGGPIKAAEGDFVKDSNGNIVIPKLNTQELATLADAGKGLFMTLRDDNEDIDRLSGFFEQAVVQQNADTNEVLLQQWAEKGPWLLLGIIPLAALSFRKGLLSVALLLLLPLPKNSYAYEWQDLWQTKDQQAQQAFQQQDFAKAAEQFKNPDWQAAAEYKAGNYQKAADSLKNAQSADDFYNQGNALAQAGQLPEAIKAYEQALKLNPNDADTKANKELVEKELKKQQEQKDKDKNKDKQEPKKDDQGKPSDKSDKDGDQQKPDQDGQKPKDADKDKDTSKPPEQKPESDQEKDAKKAQEKAQQEKEAQKAAEQKPADKPPEAKAASAEDQQKKNETEQANEQWLKRIPDDPAGLLKRKFKYQYGQQTHQAPTNTDAW